MSTRCSEKGQMVSLGSRNVRCLYYITKSHATCSKLQTKNRFKERQGDRGESKINPKRREEALGNAPVAERMEIQDGSCGMTAPQRGGPHTLQERAPP